MGEVTEEPERQRLLTWTALSERDETDRAVAVEASERIVRLGEQRCSVGCDQIGPHPPHGTHLFDRSVTAQLLGHLLGVHLRRRPAAAGDRARGSARGKHEQVRCVDLGQQRLVGAVDPTGGRRGSKHEPADHTDQHRNSQRRQPRAPEPSTQREPHEFHVNHCEPRRRHVPGCRCARSGGAGTSHPKFVLLVHSVAPRS